MRIFTAASCTLASWPCLPLAEVRHYQGTVERYVDRFLVAMYASARRHMAVSASSVVMVGALVFVALRHLLSVLEPSHELWQVFLSLGARCCSGKEIHVTSSVSVDSIAVGRQVRC